jgi:hypothetical protein
VLQGHYLHRTTQTQKKRGQTYMPRVVFEPTIPVFEGEKKFHVLDHATTVIGTGILKNMIIIKIINTNGIIKLRTSYRCYNLDAYHVLCLFGVCHICFGGHDIVVHLSMCWQYELDSAVQTTQFFASHLLNAEMFVASDVRCTLSNFSTFHTYLTILKLPSFFCQ